jgi:hypothetical protein
VRESNVCALEWTWEVAVPEVGWSVFVIPPEALQSPYRRVSCGERFWDCARILLFFLEPYTTEMTGALIAAIEVATHPLAMPLVRSNIEFSHGEWAADIRVSASLVPVWCQNAV